MLIENKNIIFAHRILHWLLQVLMLYALVEISSEPTHDFIERASDKRENGNFFRNAALIT